MSLIEQRRSSVLVLVFSLSIFLFLNRGWFGEMQLGDDVYIYLQYVRNIIDGGGIAFNADEPSYGFTSVLWLEALLIWTAISGNYLGGPLVFSLACSVGVILCAWFFATNDSRLGVTAFAIPMLFSIEPNLLKHALIGLETPLAGLLVMAGVLFHKREQKSLGRFPWSAVLFAASLLNRPESLLIVILVLLDKLIAQTHWKHSIMWLLLVVIPAGVWGVMAQFLTGSFFPTTAAAKGGAYPPFGSFSANLHDS